MHEVNIKFVNITGSRISLLQSRLPIYKIIYLLKILTINEPASKLSTLNNFPLCLCSLIASSQCVS